MRKYISKVNKLLQAFSKLCLYVKSEVYKDFQIRDRQMLELKKPKINGKTKSTNHSACITEEQYPSSQRLQLQQTLGCCSCKSSKTPTQNLSLPSFQLK